MACVAAVDMVAPPLSRLHVLHELPYDAHIRCANGQAQSSPADMENRAKSAGVSGQRMVVVPRPPEVPSSRLVKDVQNPRTWFIAHFQLRHPAREMHVTSKMPQRPYVNR